MNRLAAVRNALLSGSLAVVLSAAGAQASVSGWFGVGELPPGVVYQTESLYQRVVVRDANGVRSLITDRLNQSAIDLGDPERLVYDYSRLIWSMLVFHPQPQDVLLIGLGGGVLPGILQKYYPRTRLDIVELDEVIHRVAKEYFQFKETPATRVFIEDGRVFLKRHPERYDLIILDAFRGEYIPFHLMTREFLLLVRDHLKPGGAVIGNTWSTHRLADAELKTYRSVFPELYSFQGANRILVGPLEPRGLSPEEIQRIAAELQQRHRFKEFDLVEQARRLAVLSDGADAPLLTDDYAPVNFMNAPP